jgi:hypothetical protein
MNIHIGCAGRSKMATEGFILKDQVIVFDDEETWDVRVQKDRDGLIYWRHDRDDWVRIENEGRFSLRRYKKGVALMTRGRCRQVPEATR